MIRPYVAILVDSFREALASRVLWILMFVIVLVLGVLTCLSVVDDTSWEFSPPEFDYPTTIVQEMYEASQQKEPSLKQHLWTLLDEETRNRFAELLDGSSQRGGRMRERIQERLSANFTRLLGAADLYQDELWKDVDIHKDARELLARDAGELSVTELAHRNRRLLEAAFPSLITAGGGTAYFPYFMHWKIPVAFARTRQGVEVAVNKIIVQILTLFVGVGGIFAAILTTSSIVPKTFEEGSIDLLLSKPVTRPLLYLTKFMGGCMFIMLTAGVFLLGLWFIAGWRTGVWNSGILQCIYVFLFIFGMYYSVSSFFGVIWRNAIVSVVCVVVFWFLCLVIGQVRQTANLLWFDQRRIANVQTNGDLVWGKATNGSVQRWSAETSAWREFLRLPDQREFGGIRIGGRVVGPIWDAQREVWIAVPAVRLDDRDALVTPHVLWGAMDSVERSIGAALPGAGIALFPDGDGGYYLVCSSEIYRLAGELTKAPEEQPPFQMFGRTIPLPIKFPAGPPVFAKITPEDWLHNQSPGQLSVAYDAATQAFAFYRGGTVWTMRMGDEQLLDRVNATQVDGFDDATVAWSGKTIVLAADKGHVAVLNADDLRIRATFEDVRDARLDGMAMSSDGSFCAIEWSDHHIDVLDCVADQFVDPIPGQGNVTAASFAPSGNLLIVDKRSRWSEYDLSSRKRLRRETPSLNGWEMAFYYLLEPVYFVVPKPSELGAWTYYLVTGEKSVPTELPGQAMSSIELDLWGPVWSCGAFTMVMLGLGCLYVWRKDF